MAFNWASFKTRTLTAIIFVIVMLAGLLWNQWSFLALISIIHFGCWWEYLGLTEKIHRSSFHPYAKLGFMLMGYGFMLWFCGPYYRIGNYVIRDNIALPVSAAGLTLSILGLFQKRAVKPIAFGAAALGWVYISWSWGLMLNLYHRPIDILYHNHLVVLDRRILPIIIISSIWINDTMAYIVGSLIGKTSLSRISPKKTWEGTIGGIILSVVITGLLIPLIYLGSFDYHFFRMIAPIAATASITGTFGDLLESKLKRMAGVKDSGSLMPGHGGFLDRFDSLLVASFFVWLFVTSFM